MASVASEVQVVGRHYDLIPAINDRGIRRAVRLARQGLAVVWSIVPTRFAVVFCIVGLLLGTLIGAMVAILPPPLLAIPGVVIALVVVLIPLTFPEMRRVPVQATRNMFFAFVVAEMTLPIYVGVSGPGLPLISVVRMVFAGMAVPFVICIAGSAEVRQKIKAAVATEKAICYAVIALFIAFALSVPLSLTPLSSARSLVNLLISWLLPFFAAIFVLDDERRQTIFTRIIIICTMFTVALACVEFLKEERLFLRLVPASVLERDPIFAASLALSLSRTGAYRASAHLTHPILFAEFCALVMPIDLYMTMHAGNARDRVLGAFGIPTAILGVFLANSRGGGVALIAGVSVFAILFSLKAVYLKRGGMVGPVLVVLVPIALSIVPAAMLASHKVTTKILGGAETQSSTDDRILQWNMGWPSILRRPI